MLIPGEPDSVPAAAQFLAEWVLRPVRPAQGGPADAAQDGDGSIGDRLSIRGNGTTAQVIRSDDQPATDYDATGLQDMMLSLITGQSG